MHMWHLLLRFLSRRTERESRQSLVELKRAWEARTGA